MDLQSKNKLATTFSLASMTDIIFMLLIFFMLTSSFVAPSALPVELPSSESSTKSVTPNVHVTITSNLEYFVNDKVIQPQKIEIALRSALNKAKENKVILSIDKSVPVEHLVKVASVANKLNAKVAIATKLEDPKKQKLEEE